jgi:hypothetical protein
MLPWASCPGQSKKARSDHESLEPVEASSKGVCFMSILSAPGRPGQCQTVHEVIEMYLAQARRDLSTRSYETVSCILHRFDESAGQMTLAECRPFDLQCSTRGAIRVVGSLSRRCIVLCRRRLAPQFYRLVVEEMANGEHTTLFPDRYNHYVATLWGCTPARPP